MDLTEVQELLVSIFSQLLPQTPFTSYVLDNVFLVVTVLLVLVLLAVLGINFFFDIITDIWKVPLAVIVDIGFYFGLFSNVALIISIIVGTILFFFIGDSFWHYLFAIILLGVGLGFLFFQTALLALLVLLPLATLFMLIDIVID